MRTIIAILLLAWTCSAAAPTEFKKTIGEAGAPTYDFTTLALWEDACDGDLVTSNVFAVASIEGNWTSPDSTATTITGWTTSEDCYICITNSTSKHGGKWDTTKHILQKANASSILITEEFVRVDGLQIETSSANGNEQTVYVDPIGHPSDVRISNCILKGHNNNSYASVAIYLVHTNISAKIWNCAMWNFGSSADSIGFRSANCTNAVVYNCSVYGAYKAFSRAVGTVTTINCIAQGATDGWSGTIGGDYNVSNVASDAPSASYRSGEAITVTFTDAANGDLHTSDADVVDDGVSDPGSGLFTDDIDYVARTGSWDIGADEYVAAASGAQVIIINCCGMLLLAPTLTIAP